MKTLSLTYHCSMNYLSLHVEKPLNRVSKTIGFHYFLASRYPLDRSHGIYIWVYDTVKKLINCSLRTPIYYMHITWGCM